jgi:hydrogenase maturation protein HypF
MGPACRKLDLHCWQATTAARWGILEKLIVNPMWRTSSCGRLFDAVSSICGLTQDNSYEGEAAMLLEAAADNSRDGAYDIDLDTTVTPWIVDSRPMLSQIACEIAAGRSVGTVSRLFHDSLAQMVETVCCNLRKLTDIQRVCLSGGTFQNVTLLQATVSRLRREGFEVSMHARVPANDGGLSLGQAVIAAAASEGAL